MLILPHSFFNVNSWYCRRWISDLWSHGNRSERLMWSRSELVSKRATTQHTNKRTNHNNMDKLWLYFAKGSWENGRSPFVESQALIGPIAVTNHLLASCHLRLLSSPSLNDHMVKAPNSNLNILTTVTSISYRIFLAQLFGTSLEYFKPCNQLLNHLGMILPIQVKTILEPKSTHLVAVSILCCEMSHLAWHFGGASPNSQLTWISNNNINLGW
jgi:hypothetical protein